MEDRDKVKPACPECGSTETKRIMQDSMTFQIAENCSPVSCKPDSYFENAERNKIARLKKRQAEEQEKRRYDEKYREKLNAAARRQQQMEKSNEGYEAVRSK